MLTGRRYRLELTPEQTEFAGQIGGICRSVWNTALEQRRTYRRRGAFIGYAGQCAQLADAKRDFPWLAEAPPRFFSKRSRTWTPPARGTARGRSAGSPRPGPRHRSGSLRAR